MSVNAILSKEVWHEPVLDALKLVDNISDTEAQHISCGIALFCDENKFNYLKHSDILLLVAKGLFGLGRLHDAKTILRDDNYLRTFTESWSVCFQYIDNFGSLFPFFSRGVILPGEWSGLQNETMWVLDLNRLLVTAEELHEMMVYQSIQVLLRRMIFLWEHFSGKGVLAISGLMQWSMSILSDKDAKGGMDHIVVYMDAVLKKEAKIHGWKTHPDVIIL